MQPSVKTLGESLYAPSQYVIPVFQRNYRWEMPVAHGQYTAAHIPNARFATQEFGIHFVYVRDAVLEEIRAFIDPHGRTP